MSVAEQRYDNLAWYCILVSFVANNLQQETCAIRVSKQLTAAGDGADSRRQTSLYAKPKSVLW